MNRTTMFCIALTACMVASAIDRPILVGHRGSDIGLENSVQSFTVGAQRGYEYLETDIKVTSDGQFVCSHDDNTTRLGGTLTIASSTLEALQSETLTQTRNGVQYTGTLASLGDLLDICSQYNCKPLIELKWATGINSNDCSGIPALISFIENRGFRDKCIILTSMKACLEYIRTNYPDIELQFLTNANWSSHFDWCVEQGIDADIQADCFDKATIDQFHAAGLKVNMWTTNTNDGYRTYALMGCDFITTDMLDPTNLPDLNAPIEETTFELTQVWCNSSANGNAPEHINGAYAQQGAARQGIFYVNDCNDQLLYFFDQTGCIGSLPGGIGYGTALDDAGNIIIRNDKATGTEHSLLVYPAGTMPDNPVEAIPIDFAVLLEGQTNFISASGDVLAGTGRLYLFPNKQTGINIVTITEKVAVECTKVDGLRLTGSTAGYVIPQNDDPNKWAYMVRNSGLYYYDNGVSSNISPSTGTTPPARNSTGGCAIFEFRGHQLMLHNSGANYKGGFTLRDLTADNVVTSVDPIGIYGYGDITDPDTGEKIGVGNMSTFNWLFAEPDGDDAVTIYQYCASNGMAVYRLTDTADGIATPISDSSELRVRSTTDGITLLTNADIHAVALYDIKGQQIATTYNPDTKHLTISVDPGIYILIAHTPDSLLTAKLLR